MLTADLVRARRRGGELQLLGLRGETRARALELARLYLDVAADAVGATRGELDERWDAVRLPSREQKLAAGLRKLVADRCDFEADPTLDPALLRADVFARAAAARRALPAGAHLERDVVLREAAVAWEREVDELEGLLYADLRSSHRLLAFAPSTPEALVAEHELGQAQAVLLRAEGVTATVLCASPGAYRHLFRKLKFLRLLHTIEPLDDGRYRLVVDGPFSMFTSGTKYGLQLALLLPALRECDRFDLEATVRWGKERARLTFRTSGGLASDGGPHAPAPPHLADEVAELLARFESAPGRWRASPSAELLPLPGVGVCVPDLAFHHVETGEVVFLEVLGYWSRAAVWKRVELVERGLPTKVLFAVPERLRVSEEVLGDALPGALYVFKGVLRRKAIEERLDRLAEGPSDPLPASPAAGSAAPR